MVPLLIALQMFSLPPASRPFPPTVPWNDANGVQIGTATIDGNRMYLRTKSGKFVATVVEGLDGSKALFDENGKLLDKIPGRVPNANPNPQ